MKKLSWAALRVLGWVGFVLSWLHIIWGFSFGTVLDYLVPVIVTVVLLVELRQFLIWALPRPGILGDAARHIAYRHPVNDRSTRESEVPRETRRVYDPQRDESRHNDFYQPNGQHIEGP